MTDPLACADNTPSQDFNCPPDDATYALLTGQPLNTDHKTRLSLSRVTHISIDPTVPKTPAAAANDGEAGGESEESDPDRVIINARGATEADGLLNDEELVALFTRGHRLQSAYNEGLLRIQNCNVALFGQRARLESTQPGFHEPAYTSYTHYWKSVLGICFLFRDLH